MPNGKPGLGGASSDTLDLMVLQAVASAGPLHGYGIASQLERIVETEGAHIDLRALYPSITRLAQRGFLRADSTVGRRQNRCYAISASGHRHLEGATVEWERASHLMTAAL